MITSRSSFGSRGSSRTLSSSTRRVLVGRQARRSPRRPSPRSSSSPSPASRSSRAPASSSRVASSRRNAATTGSRRASSRPRRRIASGSVRRLGLRELAPGRRRTGGRPRSAARRGHRSRPSRRSCPGERRIDRDGRGRFRLGGDRVGVERRRRLGQARGLVALGSVPEPAGSASPSALSASSIDTIATSIMSVGRLLRRDHLDEDPGPHDHPHDRVRAVRAPQRRIS